MTKHVKARWRAYMHDLSDGSYIDGFGDVGYVKNGKLHRDDGPAIEWSCGTKSWFINGKCHRDDGPAQEYANGAKEWFINYKKYYTEEAYWEAIKIWKMNKAME